MLAMKNAKKSTALILAAAMMLLISAKAFGLAYAENDFTGGLPSYGMVTGEVIEVDNEYEYRIRIEGEQGTADFIVTPNTFILGEYPQVGDTITGFFDNRLPIMAIYPPRYTAVVIDNGESGSVFVDRFYASYDGEMLSADGQRRLNVSNPVTEIISQEGQDAAGWDLEGRLLVVVYDTATRSLPPLIFAPERIIVMYEIAVHPGPADIDWDFYHDVVVNGIGLPGISFHTEGYGLFPTHVPIRAVMEFMDPEGLVLWNSGTVSLSGQWGEISFRVGSSVVTVNGKTVLLNEPTVLIESRTQVPFSFFTQVLGMNNAFFEGGTVFIDDFEKMQ
jgi:hypothetical protein